MDDNVIDTTEEEFPMIDWEDEPEGIWLSEWMDAMGISPESGSQQ